MLSRRGANSGDVQKKTSPSNSGGVNMAYNCGYPPGRLVRRPPPDSSSRGPVCRTPSSGSRLVSAVTRWTSSNRGQRDPTVRSTSWEAETAPRCTPDSWGHQDQWLNRGNPQYHSHRVPGVRGSTHGRSNSVDHPNMTAPNYHYHHNGNYQNPYRNRTPDNENIYENLKPQPVPPEKDEARCPGDGEPSTTPKRIADDPSTHLRPAFERDRERRSSRKLTKDSGYETSPYSESDYANMDWLSESNSDQAGVGSPTPSHAPYGMMPPWDAMSDTSSSVEQYRYVPQSLKSTHQSDVWATRSAASRYLSGVVAGNKNRRGVSTGHVQHAELPNSSSASALGRYSSTDSLSSHSSAGVGSYFPLSGHRVLSAKSTPSLHQDEKASVNCSPSPTRSTGPLTSRSTPNLDQDDGDGEMVANVGHQNLSTTGSSGYDGSIGAPFSPTSQVRPYWEVGECAPPPMPYMLSGTTNSNNPGLVRSPSLLPLHSRQASSVSDSSGGGSSSYISHSRTVSTHSSYSDDSALVGPSHAPVTNPATRSDDADFALHYREKFLLRLEPCGHAAEQSYPSPNPRDTSYNVGSAPSPTPPPPPLRDASSLLYKNNNMHEKYPSWPPSSENTTWTEASPTRPKKPSPSSKGTTITVDHHFTYDVEDRVESAYHSISSIHLEYMSNSGKSSLEAESYHTKLREVSSHYYGLDSRLSPREPYSPQVGGSNSPYMSEHGLLDRSQQSAWRTAPEPAVYPPSDADPNGYINVVPGAIRNDVRTSAEKISTQSDDGSTGSNNSTPLLDRLRRESQQQGWNQLSPGSSSEHESETSATGGLNASPGNTGGGRDSVSSSASSQETLKWHGSASDLSEKRNEHIPKITEDIPFTEKLELVSRPTEETDPIGRMHNTLWHSDTSQPPAYQHPPYPKGLVLNSELVAHSSRVQPPQRHYTAESLELQNSSITDNCPPPLPLKQRQQWSSSSPDEKANSRAVDRKNALNLVGHGSRLGHQHASLAREEVRPVLSPEFAKPLSVAERILDLERQAAQNQQRSVRGIVAAFSKGTQPSNEPTRTAYLDPDKRHKVSDPELKAIQKQAVLSFFERQTGISSRFSSNNNGSNLGRNGSMNVMPARRMAQSLPRDAFQDFKQHQQQYAEEEAQEAKLGSAAKLQASVRRPRLYADSGVLTSVDPSVKPSLSSDNLLKTETVPPKPAVRMKLDLSASPPEPAKRTSPEGIGSPETSSDREDDKSKPELMKFPRREPLTQPRSPEKKPVQTGNQSPSKASYVSRWLFVNENIKPSVESNEPEVPVLEVPVNSAVEEAEKRDEMTPASAMSEKVEEVKTDEEIPAKPVVEIKVDPDERGWVPNVSRSSTPDLPLPPPPPDSELLPNYDDPLPPPPTPTEICAQFTQTLEMGSNHDLVTGPNDNPVSPASWERIHNIRQVATTVVFNSADISKSRSSSITESISSSQSSENSDIPNNQRSEPTELRPMPESPPQPEPRRKLTQELECERLSRSLASQLPAKEKALQNLLVPAPEMKTTADFMTGLYEKDNTSTSGAIQRRLAATNVSGSRRSPGGIVSTTQSSVLLPGDSAYFTTSESKAKFLTRYGREFAHPNSDALLDDPNLKKKKGELISSIAQKLDVLRLERTALQEEVKVNEELGVAVCGRVEQLARPTDADKLRLHADEVEKVTALLLALSGRLARAENALQTLPEGNDIERNSLIAKRDKLRDQHEEARRLKESIDLRGQQVAKMLSKYLSSDEMVDFHHFVRMKAKLLVETRELDDRIRLGDEQLTALKDSLHR